MMRDFSGTRVAIPVRVMAKGRVRALASVSGALLCLLASPSPARAAGRLLRPAGSSLAPVAARIAVAPSPSSETFWVSLGVSGGPGRFALVVPVAPGSSVDPTLDAWFDALDAATAPRVRPPLGAPACGKTSGGSMESTATTQSGTLGPSKVATFSSVPEVSVFALSEGFAFGSADQSALEASGAVRFVALSYETKTSNATTETVRFALPSAGSEIALGLLEASSHADVTLYTIAPFRARAAGAAELEPDQLMTTWHVLDGKSDYVERRRELLLAGKGASWLTEATGATPLFGWNVLPAGAGSIAPAVKTYLDQAHAEDAGVPPADGCLTAVWDAVAAGKLGAHVGPACAPGLLGTVPADGGAPACDETPGPGEIAAQSLRCGAADDLALAFAGMNPEELRLTRASSVLGSATPAALAVSATKGDSISVLITATDADTTGCVQGNGPSGGAGGSGGGGWYGGNGGGNGYGASDGYEQPAPVVNQEGSSTQVDVSCSAGNNGTSDSCSGDSQSSSGNGDTCGGDSSSGSDSSSSGDTCGGDSSSSSSGDGDTCGGSSSSSSGDGDTCSSSSSGSSGDSCGSSGSSGSGDCSIGRGRRPPIRLSAFTLGLFALAFPLRRLTRKRPLNARAPGRAGKNV
jgi:hypothetical protein